MKALTALLTSRQEAARREGTGDRLTWGDPSPWPCPAREEGEEAR